jgi:hypothetical protein
MKFEVYCDEALPDLFTSKKPRAQYLMIGAVWLPASIRAEAKEKIAALRETHNVHGELKWRKISPSSLNFYEEIIDLFFAYGSDLRFRCIAVDHTKTDMATFHDGDGELGFYKFYYQLLHHWILDFNEYRVFCDLKTSRSPTRLAELRRVLTNANLSAEILDVQPLPSGQLVLMQLCDILLGAASSRLNGDGPASPAKRAIVERIETRLGRKLGPTWKSEEKFNVFKINLQGGW